MMSDDNDELVMCDKDMLVDENKIERDFGNVKFNVGQHSKQIVDQIFNAINSKDLSELDQLFDKVEKRALDMCTLKGPLPDMPAKAISPNVKGSSALNQLKAVVKEKNKQRDIASKQNTGEIDLNSSAVYGLRNDETQLSKNTSTQNVYQVSDY